LENYKRTKALQAMNEAELLEIILEAFEANMLDVLNAIVDLNSQTKINSLLNQIVLGGEIYTTYYY